MTTKFATLAAAAAKLTAALSFACSQYKELVDKVHSALKAAITEAQMDTAYDMPLLSEILTKFEDEQEGLKGHARAFWDRAQKDRRQEESHHALLLAVKANNNRAVVQAQPAQAVAPVFHTAPVAQPISRPHHNFDGQVCKRWDGHVCHHEHETGYACKMPGTFIMNCYHGATLQCSGVCLCYAAEQTHMLLSNACADEPCTFSC